MRMTVDINEQPDGAVAVNIRAVAASSTANETLHALLCVQAIKAALVKEGSQITNEKCDVAAIGTREQIAKN